MKKLIACCGLDCQKCDAFIATVNNNQALRERTAKLWSKLNNAAITPEMINCTGCRGKGVKTFFCNELCEIRKCVNNKGFATCAQCGKLNNCNILLQIHKNNPDALKNLR